MTNARSARFRSTVAFGFLTVLLIVAHAGGLVWPIIEAAASSTAIAGYEIVPCTNSPFSTARPWTVWDVIERSAACHPDVVRAVNAVEAAGNDLEARHAAFAPTLSVSGTAINWRTPPQRTGTQTPSVQVSGGKNFEWGLSTSASLSLSLSEDALRNPSWNVTARYPLFRSAPLNSDNMNVRQAEMALEMARRQLFQSRSNAVVETLQHYHQTVRAETALHQARIALEEAEAEWESVSRQRDMGIVDDVAALDAQSERLRRELAFTQAERTYNERLASLAEAIGIPEDGRSIRLTPWSSMITPAVDADIDEWIERVAQFDPALWQRQRALETAQLQWQAEVEKSRIETNLSVGVSKGRQGQDSNSQDLPLTWSVQVNFSYPIADGGARQRALHTRQIALEEAEKAYEDELKALTRRVQTLFHALTDAQINEEIEQLQREKARLAMDQARSRYELGLVTVNDVRRAERSYQQAVEQYEAAVLTVYVAWWDLHIAAGIVPDFGAIFAIESNEVTSR